MTKQNVRLTKLLSIDSSSGPSEKKTFLIISVALRQADTLYIVCFLRYTFRVTVTGWNIEQSIE